MKKILAAIVVLAAVLVVTPPAVSAPPEQAAKVYVGAKIDQPGRTLGPADTAAAAGAARMQPVDTARRMWVQKRPAGGTNPWVTIKSGTPNRQGYMFFKAWSTAEYRTVLGKHGGYSRIVSSVQGYDWETVFSDDFDGAELTPAWVDRGTSHVTGSTRARGDRRAVDVSAGAAHLRVLRDPDTPGNYLNGHVGTQESFTFTGGWAAARVKFHRHRGAHSAFWLQGAGGYTPDHTEVDVAEYFGSDYPTGRAGTELQQNLYYDWTADGVYNLSKVQTTVNDVQTLPPGQRWWDSYHVFSVRWIPGQAYMFYVDGVKVRTLTEGVATKPGFLVLSMLTRDWEADRVIDSQIGTYSMDVDWVRVWQQTG